MKPLWLAAALLLSFTSVAFAEVIVCKIADADQTLLIKKLGNLPSDKNSEKARYLVQAQTSELPFPDMEAEGVGKTQDAQLTFEDDEKNVTVALFLEDMAGTLYLKGEKPQELRDCRYLTGISF